MSDIIVNKVIKGDETYLDLTNDTVSEGALLKNRTAHNSEGIQIQGTMEEGGGSVTGVKGDDESVYRDGDVNITAANIGTYTTSQIDALLNNKVDVHGTDSLMTNAEHVKLAGIEAGAEENVIESISLNGEEITPVNKAVALSVIDKDVDDLTNYYKKSETDASLGAKQNIILSSTLSIGGQTVTEVEEALESLAGISKPMTGATSSAAGEGGFVPSPSAGDENKALFGDGTWKPVSSGGGGHTILDEDGTTYPQRSKLQFEGCEVTDDSTNDITKIKAEGGVTGVKGNSESTYRTGNVNLTPAHVGAVDEVEYEEDIYGVNLLSPNACFVDSGSGVTFTVNSDGSVTANGTAVGDVNYRYWRTSYFKEGTYILNGCALGGSHLTYYVYFSSQVDVQFVSKRDIGEGVEFEFNNNDNPKVQAGIVIKDGTTVTNLTFHPMLRKATIQDDTYRPYNQQSIQHQLTEQTNVLGAKNLIPYPYYSADGTYEGVTFTTDSDGIITNSAGTTSAWLDYVLVNKRLYKSGSYRLVASGVADNLIPRVVDMDVTPNNDLIKWRNGVTEFTLTKHTNLKIMISANASKAITAGTIKIMLVQASDPDDTYVPYAMTNRELTEVTTETLVGTFNQNNSLMAMKCGKMVTLVFTNTPWSSVKSLTLPAKYRPSVNIAFPAIIRNGPIYYTGVWSMLTTGVMSSYYEATYGADRVAMPDAYLIYGTFTYIAN